MNNNSIATKNELIAVRRKKRRQRRVFMLMVLMIAILITLALKLSYFNIKSIEVTNNFNLTANEVIKTSGIFKDNNIFYVSFRKSKDNLLSNPYILDVKLKRKLPSTVIIDIKERNAVFYINADNKLYVVDKDGVVLEEKSSIAGMKLTKLDGVNADAIKIGKPLAVDDSRKIDVIRNITELLAVNNSSIVMTSLDISDIINLKAYYGNMCVKLGNGEDLRNKLNKAVSIMASNKDLVNTKGYIDVGFEGNPVIHIDK